MINGAAALAGLVRTATGTDEPGGDRMLPVAAELSGLLPGRGLRRGSTVAVAGGKSMSAGGVTSLMLALLAAASRNGSWCAVVGVPTLGALAAAESGIVLERLALVPNPGPDWPTVVAALIDGVDVVVAAVPGPVSGPIVSRLAARARQRGSLLVPFGDWSGADVTLRVGQGRWEGLGSGRGRLRRREVTVVAQGRGAAARPREITMWMPGVTVRSVTIPPAPSRPDDHVLPERADPGSPVPTTSCPDEPDEPARAQGGPPVPTSWRSGSSPPSALSRPGVGSPASQATPADTGGPANASARAMAVCQPLAGPEDAGGTANPPARALTVCPSPARQE